MFHIHINFFKLFFFLERNGIQESFKFGWTEIFPSISVYIFLYSISVSHLGIFFVNIKDIPNKLQLFNFLQQGSM